MAKQPGLDDRHRDNDGETERKKGNTLVRTLRDTYGEDFAEGHRSDMMLETLLDINNCDTLREYQKKRVKK
jgi:hypothetical protein